jgi:hypothetical protein
MAPRTLLLILIPVISFTTCKKAGDSNFNGKYYFEMQIDGQQFSFQESYPFEQNSPYLMTGTYNSAVGVSAGRDVCHEPGTVCYGFTISINKQKPGTYDPDTVTVQITDNSNEPTNYYYLPGKGLGVISCTIRKIDLYENPDKWGLIEGTFEGTIAKNYGFNGQPAALVTIKGKFGVPNVN